MSGAAYVSYSLTEDAFLSFSLNGLRWWCILGGWHEVRSNALLFLEHLGCLPFILIELSLSLISQLIVDFDLICSHLDVFLNYANLLLFLGPLEVEIVWVLACIIGVVVAGDGSGLGSRLSWSHCLLFFIVFIQHLVCL